MRVMDVLLYRSPSMPVRSLFRIGEGKVAVSVAEQVHGKKTY
jgi:hypothetical protein